MDYPIDYSLYSTEEIVEIIDFLHQVELHHNSNDTKQQQALLKQYTTFSNIINNKAEEKTIDQAFEKQTGVSIYRTIKAFKEA